MARGWLQAREAAQRLGVKPETLYAYASRGQLRRRAAADGRRSEYHPDDVAALAVRGRRSRPPRSSDVVVATSVTAITPAGPAYRGHLAADLAGEVGLEETAALLWRAEHTGDWRAVGSRRTAARAAAGQLPSTVEPAQRLLVALGAARLADPLRGDLRPAAVARVGRELVSVLVDVAGDGPGHDAGSVAARLAAALVAEPDAEVVTVVDAALVLLADHELAVSTLAARIAASARCDPYSVVLTGLSVLSGPRHGAASRPLERALADIAAGSRPDDALARYASERGHVPGFGHPLYPDGDPRARRLVTLLLEGTLASSCGPLRAALDAAEDGALPPPNVDAALAGLTHAMGAPPGTAELLFALGRSVGWIAHAMEQYDDPQLLRPRAVYTGTEPPA